MNQDDKILQINLKALGMQEQKNDLQKTILETQPQTIVMVTVKCLGKIMQTAPQDKVSFIDPKILQNANKIMQNNSRPLMVKLCTTFVQYFKNLQYRSAIGFNEFLYPEGKSTRKLLNFLTQVISKYSQKDAVKATQLTAFQLKVLKSMRNWMSRPWIMPEFTVPSKKPINITNTNQTVIDPHLTDYKLAPPRVQNAKVQRVFDVLYSKQSSFKKFSARDLYKSSSGNVLQNISQSNEIKIQRIKINAEKLRNKNDVEESGLLRQEDEQDQLQRSRKMNQEKLKIKKSMARLFLEKKSRVNKKKKKRGIGKNRHLDEIGEQDDDDDDDDNDDYHEKEGEEGENQNKQAGGSRKKRSQSLEGIFEQRQKQQKKAQAMQKAEESSFQQKIQFQSQDAGGVLHPQENVEVKRIQDKNQMNEQLEKDIIDNQQQGVDEQENKKLKEQKMKEIEFRKKQSQKKMEIQQNMQSMKKEKESEIQQLQNRLNQIQNKFFKLQVSKNKKEADILQITDTLPKLELEYKDLKKNTQLKHTLLKALEQEQQNSFNALSNQKKKVQDLEKELQALDEQWDEYKKPLVQQIQVTQQQVKQKRVEYQFKRDQVLQMRADINRAAKQVSYKEDLMKFMQEEYENAPKDLTRNAYTKKINDVISQLKSSQKQIAGTVEQIRDLQTKTNSLVHAVKVLDEQLEDLIFQSAKKESVSKNIYKDMQSFKKVFDVLITSLQQQVNVKNTLRDVEKKTQDVKLKFQEMNIKSLEEDIANVRAENQEIEKKLKSRFG